MAKAGDVDAYIAAFPADVQARLKQMRATIRRAAPKAEEGVSYGMPAYRLNGAPLVYFAGMKSHVGFYATPTGHARFAKELSKYKTGKGSVQFPNDAALPLGLVTRMVKFRAGENAAKAAKTPAGKRRRK